MPDCDRTLGLVAWGALNAARFVVRMAWMSRNADDGPETAGSLMVAAFQISILLGAVIGGALLERWSTTTTFVGSGVHAAVSVAPIGSGIRPLKPAS